MQEELDTPESVDGLYEARGDVPIALPLMQGDVFDEVEVPSLSQEPISAIVVSHPCTMRNGATLRERLTVAPVRPENQRINNFVWKRHVNKMPLPELREERTGFVADLRDVAPAPLGQLSLRKRVAALSNQGILLLQQRYIYSATRLIVEVEQLGKASTAIFMETELQRIWVEDCLAGQGDSDPEEALQKAISSFQEWLSADNNARRKKLSQVHLYTDLRRETQREIAKRFMI